MREEVRALRRRHLAAQQLRGTLYRRERALQLVRERLHVALDIGLAFQPRAHGVERGRELMELAARKIRHGRPFTCGDRIGIAREPADGMIEPPGQQAPDNQAREHVQAGQHDQVTLRARDEWLHAVIGLGHGDHADDAVAILHRGGHMHHGAALVAGHRLCGAGAIAPAQS